MSTSSITKKNMQGDAKENMVNSFFIHKFLSFFKRSILSDITNTIDIY